MPTQTEFNAAVIGLVESEAWESASLSKKEALFSSLLESYENLWTIVGSYIGQLFNDFMDWLTNHSITIDPVSGFLDDWFASVLNGIVPWPIIGGGD